MELEQYLKDRGDHLLKFAYLHCGDAHRAEDLVQGVLTRAFGRKRSLLEIDDLDAYLRRAIINHSNTWWRRKTTTSERADSGGGGAAAGAMLTEGAQKQSFDIQRLTLDVDRKVRARRRRSRVAAAVSAGAVAACLIGVFAGGLGRSGSTTAVDLSKENDADTPIVIVSATTLESYPAALLVGELSQTSSRCLLLNGAPVVFPPGTRLEEPAGTIEIPSGTRVQIASSVSLPGGYLPFSEGLTDIVGRVAVQAVEDCMPQGAEFDVALVAPTT